MPKLGVNIDHVATLRQARYAGLLDAPNCEPNILAAASACERAGAQGITIHLRADRRHIQDQDVFRLRSSIITKLNLELGNSSDILETALTVLPDDVCLVPENRLEVTTEGGLDVAKNAKALRRTVERLHAAGIRVSMFIEPMADQINASADLGVEAVELHTGAYANAAPTFREDEIERLRAAANLARERGLVVNAGHGINYDNIKELLSIKGWNEFNIGHSIVSRALFTGLEGAVREMIRLIEGNNS
ncbi:MAG: pyridoxine 5'-phosphate synthase [Verrucomicrobia bacterium]|nr:pyridoxine 5'-phosphate synthase [Verrucomicrobiota bacterium]MBV9273580.1 pyridoxine 5'-phosphate synthase [Verrucomicrobiota bacterium]